MPEKVFRAQNNISRKFGYDQAFPIKWILEHEVYFKTLLTKLKNRSTDPSLTDPTLAWYTRSSNAK